MNRHQPPCLPNRPGDLMAPLHFNVPGQVAVTHPGRWTDRTMHINRHYALLALLCLLTSLLGCGRRQDVSSIQPSNTVASVAPAQQSLIDPTGDFVLYVQEETFAVSAIQIDGQSIALQDFTRRIPHANYLQYVLRLSPGPHVFSAQSVQAGTNVTQAFTVTGKHWASASLSFIPDGGGRKRFNFDVRDRPIGFL